MKRILYFSALLGFPIGLIVFGIFRGMELAYYYALAFSVPFAYFMYGMWIHVPNPPRRKEADKP